MQSSQRLIVASCCLKEIFYIINDDFLGLIYLMSIGAYTVVLLKTGIGNNLIIFLDIIFYFF